MKKILNLILIGIIAFGCKKDPIETDPAKAILGKWECVADGIGSDIHYYQPSGYIEYLPDSIMKDYDSAGRYFIHKYWIDTLLHVGIMDGNTMVFSLRSKIEFQNKNNTIKETNLTPGAIISTYIYKRKN